MDRSIVPSARACMNYRKCTNSKDALARLRREALYERAVTILGPTHPAVVVTLIKRGEYEKAAALLGLTPVPGNRDAAAAAVGRTFFGQVDNLRWTGLRVDAGTDPKFIVIRGEATHHNKIWQVFEIQMVLDVSGWKFRAIQVRPISWR